MEQVAVVTGASRGIGQAIAVSLAQSGMRVAAIARTQDGLSQTQEKISDSKSQCMSLISDVTDYNAVVNALGKVMDEWGRIDLLVNNAGLAPRYRMEQFDIAEFDQMMSVNCAGMFYAIHAVWPIMIQRGGGQIVNISSIAAVDPLPGFQSYGATKAWVNMLTQSLAKEGKQHNIRVFAVAPGAVDTQLLRKVAPDLPAEQCLRPKDVAEAVNWIIDPKNKHATGSIVYVEK